MTENPFTDGQQFSAARLNSMYNAHENNGVLSGCVASSGVNSFDVDVTSGNVFLNGSNINVSAATVSHATSDPEDRVDLLSVDDTGTVNVTQGTPAATSGQPVAPDIPSGEILIALVFIRGGSSEILTGDIFNDYRVTLATNIPAFQSPQGDFTNATVSNSPANPTDVVRQNELVSGNPHADSAGFNDLPEMQEFSESTSYSSNENGSRTYASFSFSQTAYLHSFEISAGSTNDDVASVISRISTNNFSTSVSAQFTDNNTKRGAGGFDRTTNVNLIADDTGESQFNKASGGISAKFTVLVFPSS